MGLKSGSRDAELDESESEERETTDESTVREASDSEQRSESRDRSRTHVATDDPDRSSESESNTSQTTDRPTMSSIPYKLRRDRVNEGREQVPYFLREEIIDAEDELQNTLEEILGEDVYKSDYREAAMVVAQRNPGLVAEVLREWGYDLETV